MRSGTFSFIPHRIVWACFCDFSPDPGRDPYGTRNRKDWTAPGGKSPVRRWLFRLHGLADDIADGVRRVSLHLRRGVGVGAESEARAVMTQRSGERLDVHAVL